MNALVLAPFSKSGLDRLRRRLQVSYESWMDTRKLLTAQEFIGRIRDESLEVLIVEADFVQREVFDATKSLRLLGVCRADTNHVDVQAATDNGVVVVNTPARNAVGVAELAIGLMLSVARRIPPADSMVRSRSWTDPMAAYFSLRGVELTGKTVGIVGLGAIGREVAKRLAAFDSSIVACDPYVSADAAAQVGARIVPLEELVADSDIITLHCPVNPQTFGMISADMIGRMKSTAILVNTASSYVVDGQALVDALQNHRIAGAAFDVYDAWPARVEDPLLDLDNVVLTPHVGGATWETIDRYSNMIADDVEAFLQGRRPANLCNPEVWEKRVR